MSESPPTPGIGNFMDIIRQALSGSESYVHFIPEMKEPPPHAKIVQGQENAKLRGRPR
jgi:hypothetical protein